MSDIRPNKLHELASYNVQYDLYMMKPDDFNAIQDSLTHNEDEDGDLNSLAFNFVKKPERLLISSSGNKSGAQALVSPNQGDALGSTNRHFRGKNYHINNIDINSYISPSKNTGGAKYTNASLNISEPYGATLLENLIKATVQFGGKNYIEMPYMLKISFKGWDIDGNPSSSMLGAQTTKWLMLKIGDINFKVAEEGTDYNTEMYNYSDQAFGMLYGSMPVDVQINSKTLNDFFQFEEIGDSVAATGTTTNTVGTQNYTGQAYPSGHPRHTSEISTTTTDKTYKSFADILNTVDKTDSDQKAIAEGFLPDQYAFKLDKGCGEEALKLIKEAKILKADSLDANNMPVYSDLITAAGIETAGISNNPNAVGTTALQLTKGMGIETVIKTVISTSTFMTDQVTVSSGGNPNYPQDNLQYSLVESEEKPLWLYKITPIVKILDWDSTRNQYAKHITYVISLFQSQGRAETATPSYGLKDVVKKYDYIYTGQNKDVLEFDMTFDTAAFDPEIRGGYKRGIAGSIGGIDPSSDQRSNSPEVHVAPFTTAYHSTRYKQGIWQTGSESDYRTVMAKNFMSRIYQGGADKLIGTLTIIGDPDFITQQEGFGISKHSSLWINHSVNTHKDPIVHLKFLTPPDINTETGLLETHSGGPYSGNTISIFSGYYRVLLINSTIEDNLFKQVLQLIRVEVQEEQIDAEVESTVDKDQNKVAATTKNTNYNFHNRNAGTAYTVIDDDAKTSQKDKFVRHEPIHHYRPTEKNVKGSWQLSDGAIEILARDLKSKRLK